MAKAVFTTKLSPAYDDLPEERYHFGQNLLNDVLKAVGDQIVYYEPRRTSTDASSRGGRKGYFAIAQVMDVVPDPVTPKMYYATIANYLNFDTVVPFRGPGGTFESKLTRGDGGTNKGAFGRSVRVLPDHEFEAILAAGFHTDPWEQVPQTNKYPAADGLSEEPADFDRPLVEQTLLRPFRDRAFRRAVRLAYDNRCALTGLKLINGGGRPEVQAAHIKPVADNGPDSVRNGLALSGTIHWLFDRGLVSIDEDMTILRAKNGIPEPIERLLNPSGRLILPTDPAQRPHPKFLKHHRDFFASKQAN